MGKRIVINAYGSAGDLNPFLALARGLGSRGHRVVIASNEISRGAIESAGVEFTDVRRGFIYGHETPDQLLIHNIHNSYDDLMKVSAAADLLITHHLSLAGPLLAARTGIPWVSVAIYPLTFATYDEPLPFAPSSGGYHFTPKTYRLYLNHLSQLKLASQLLTKQSERLRAALGLAAGTNVLFADHHSSGLIIGAFSSAFAAPESNWPSATSMVGFLFDDELTGDAELKPELDRFLAEGPPPIVFTLGSAAAFDAGNFWIQSINAATILGRRAVLVGADFEYRVSDKVVCVRYAPYDKLLKRSAAFVHHGGIGTIAAALRAACPMLVLPGESSCDLFENAARASGLGVARVLTLDEYNCFSAAAELAHLLKDPSYARKASALSAIVRSETGVQTACDAIENYLNQSETAAGAAGEHSVRLDKTPDRLSGEAARTLTSRP